MQCANCGSAVGPDEKFCGDCGRPIERTAAPQPVSPAPTAEAVAPPTSLPPLSFDRDDDVDAAVPPPSRRALIIGSIVVVVVALGATAGWWFLADSELREMNPGDSRDALVRQLVAIPAPAGAFPGWTIERAGRLYSETKPERGQVALISVDFEKPGGTSIGVMLTVFATPAQAANYREKFIRSSPGFKQVTMPAPGLSALCFENPSNFSNGSCHAGVGRVWLTVFAFKEVQVADIVAGFRQIASHIEALQK